MPLVTVIVATNRTSPFLREALQSIAAQTYPHHETIVVDDGSPDAAALEAIVSEFDHARVERQRPSGVSTARNHGARLAHGELLAFLDDDDRWGPRYLAAQVATLREHPSAPAACCDVRSIGADGRPLPGTAGRARSDLDVIRRTTSLVTGTIMVRQTAFRSLGGFDESLAHAEDLDLMIGLTGLGPIAFTEEALFEYRTHDDNTTRRHRDLVRGIDRVLRRHRDRLEADAPAELVAAYRDSLRSNARYAWWSSLRSARHNLRTRHPLQATGDVLWAAGVAPLAPADAIMRRLRRIR